MTTTVGTFQVSRLCCVDGACLKCRQRGQKRYVQFANLSMHAALDLADQFRAFEPHIEPVQGDCKHCEHPLTVADAQSGRCTYCGKDQRS